MSVVPPLLEAHGALSEAAGTLRALGDEELAHRCAQAAAGLQLIAIEALDEADVEGE